MSEHPEHIAVARDVAWKSGSAYVIDKFVPIAEASVPITDLGFMRSDAVYDVVTVSRGQFFRLREHQERFARSCERMKLINPFSQEDEAKILNELVARTGLKDAFVWWAVTRGENPKSPADRLHPQKFVNRFYAFAVPYIFMKNDADRLRGIHLHVAKNYVRIPMNSVDPRAKNFCSLDLNMSLMEAGAAGAEWSVMTDGNGLLTEAPGSNIFVVKGNKVLTPLLGCLEGVTRRTAREICETIGKTVQATSVSVDDLMSADEAFLTTSAGGILPITVVDGRSICQGPGPVSTLVHNSYWDKRWQGWHGTSVTYSIRS